MAKNRDELVFLEDILVSIIKIIEYIDGFTEEDFLKNTEKQDAVIRRIEIIGEAVKNLSNETKLKYPNIKWREIAGMRDVVIHQYFGVSISMIWQVAMFEVKNLKDKIEQIIRELEENDNFFS
jgi:uncharacterized protein with HEPN domain